MAVWLNLIPQLQKTGQNSIYPSHNSLTLEGPAWGVVRNSSHVSRSAMIFIQNVFLRLAAVSNGKAAKIQMTRVKSIGNLLN